MDRDALVDASRKRIAEEGIRGLSLRSVVHEAGWTMGELAYRIGKKDDLIAELIGAERDACRKSDEIWLDRLSGLDRLGDDDLSAVIAAYIDDEATNRRESSIMWNEILIESGLDPKLQPLVTPWIDERHAFWESLLLDRRPDAAPLARLIADYVAGELIYSVVLGSEPEYRLIRDACIRRLCGGILRKPDVGRSDLPDSILDRSRTVRTRADAMSSRAHNVANATARLMAERGFAAVTHRAVADVLGLTASAVTHHFRTRAELVRAGIEALYEGQPPWVLADDLLKGQPVRQPSPFDDLGHKLGVALLRASYLVTLAATRDSSFVPLARHRRMDRGKGSAQRLSTMFPAPDRFDRCSALLASMIFAGAMINGAARGESVEREFPHVMDWLAAVAR